MEHFYRRSLVKKRFAKFRASAQGSNCDIQASPRMLAQRNSFLECSREISEIAFEACSPHFPTARNFANRFPTRQPRFHMPRSQGPASPGSRYQKAESQPAQDPDTRKSRASQHVPDSKKSPGSRCQEFKGRPAQIPAARKSGGSQPKFLVPIPNLAQIWLRSEADLDQIWTRSALDLAHAWTRSGAGLAQIWSRSGSDLE